MLERETKPLIPSPGPAAVSVTPRSPGGRAGTGGRAVDQLSIDSTAAVAECVCVWTSNAEQASLKLLKIHSKSNSFLFSLFFGKKPA